MTSLDQLRKDIADAIHGQLNTDVEEADILYARDAVMQVFSAAAQDPARLRVVLEALGLEVREGYAPSSWDGTVEMGFSPDALFDTDVPVLVCRVRPREETADG